MKLILVVILLAGCSTAETWERITVKPEDKEWRWCSLEKDGPERDGKGICFIEKECQTKWFNTTCRNVWNTCEFGEKFVQCLKDKYIWGMKIKN